MLAAIRQIVQSAASARLPADELVDQWRDLERGVDPITGKPPGQVRAPDATLTRIGHLTDLAAELLDHSA